MTHESFKVITREEVHGEDVLITDIAILDHRNIIAAHIPLGDPYFTGERLATAHLFAAAPDMLEALKLAYRIMTRRDVSLKQVDNAIACVRTAIDKSEFFQQRKDELRHACR